MLLVNSALRVTSVLMTRLWSWGPTLLCGVGVDIDAFEGVAFPRVDPQGGVVLAIRPVWSRYAEGGERAGGVSAVSAQACSDVVAAGEAEGADGQVAQCRHGAGCRSGPDP